MTVGLADYLSVAALDPSLEQSSTYNLNVSWRSYPEWHIQHQSECLQVVYFDHPVPQYPQFPPQIPSRTKSRASSTPRQRTTAYDRNEPPDPQIPRPRRSPALQSASSTRSPILQDPGLEDPSTPTLRQHSILPWPDQALECRLASHSEAPTICWARPRPNPLIVHTSMIPTVPEPLFRPEPTRGNIEQTIPNQARRCPSHSPWKFLSLVHSIPNDRPPRRTLKKNRAITAQENGDLEKKKNPQDRRATAGIQ